MSKNAQQLKDFNDRYLNTRADNTIKAAQLHEFNEDFIDFVTESSSGAFDPTSLQSSITQEEFLRLSGDTSLATAISNMDFSSINTAIESLESTLSVETFDRMSIDTVLASSISLETSGRITSDTSLQTQINNRSVTGHTHDYLPLVGGTIAGNLNVNGNVYVEGTTFTVNSETFKVKDNIILVNSGETAHGVTLIEAGMQVDRGLDDDYFFVFNENTDDFRVGQSGDTQAVATREDVPINGNLATWNAAENRFDTIINPNEFAIATHLHDDYYTSGATDALLVAKSNTGHTHTSLDVTDLSGILAGKSDTNHNHNLSGLTDVTLVSPISGQTLVYTSGGTWINSGITASGGDVDLSNYYTSGQTDILLNLKVNTGYTYNSIFRHNIYYNGTQLYMQSTRDATNYTGKIYTSYTNANLIATDGGGGVAQITSDVSSLSNTLYVTDGVVYNVFATYTTYASSSKVIKYTSDVSWTYDARSLIDKGFADVTYKPSATDKQIVTMNGAAMTGYTAFSYDNAAAYLTLNNTANGSMYIGKDITKHASGTGNLYIGTGINVTSAAQNNVVIGYMAANAGINAHGQNTLIGAYAGATQAPGYDNTFIGFIAGQYSNSAVRGVIIGGGAGYSSKNDYGVIIGYEAGYSTAGGSLQGYNNYIGAQSGKEVIGSGNTFIGYQAGYQGGTRFNNLIIENSSNLTTPLIFGNFATKYVQISNSLVLTPSTQPSVSRTGATYYDSTANKFKFFNGTAWGNIHDNNYNVLNYNVLTGATLTATGTTTINFTTTDLYSQNISGTTSGYTFAFSNPIVGKCITMNIQSTGTTATPSFSSECKVFGTYDAAKTNAISVLCVSSTASVKYWVNIINTL